MRLTKGRTDWLCFIIAISCALAALAFLAPHRRLIALGFGCLAASLFLRAFRALFEPDDLVEMVDILLGLLGAIVLVFALAELLLLGSAGL